MSRVSTGGYPGMEVEIYFLGGSKIIFFVVTLVNLPAIVISSNLRYKLFLEDPIKLLPTIIKLKTHFCLDVNTNTNNPTKYHPMIVSFVFVDF